VAAPKTPQGPLDWRVPITNPDGTPTNEFMRKWNFQTSINTGIPTTPQQLSDVLDLLGLAQGDIIYRDADRWRVLGPGAARTLLTSGGVSANPSWVTQTAHLDDFGASRGDLLFRGATGWEVLAPNTMGDILVTEGAGGDPIWATIAGVLDFISAVQGSVLFRSSAGWVALAPGTSGDVLTTAGAGADPAWAPGGGGGGGGVTSYFGVGPPSTLHTNGDLYFNTSTVPYALYVQNSSAWVAVAGGGGGGGGNIAHFGTGAPTTFFTDGDTYYDRTSIPYAGYVQDPIGGGSGTATPVVVGHTAIALSAPTAVIPFPSGAAAGDEAFIFVGGGWSVPAAPSGWTQLDNQAGANFNGFIAHKTLNSGDISTGSVTVAMAGSFDLVAGCVVISAATYDHIISTTANRSGGSAASDSITTPGSVATANLCIYFGGQRYSSLPSVNQGTQLEQLTDGSNAAGVIAAGSPLVAGHITAVFSYPSASQSGYYDAIVVISGPVAGAVPGWIAFT
jgi:hypothetical protein